ncbi:hypothetical protein ACF1FX_24855 [Streptomyces sp. NPDC014646]|uniref:hypothetical protein n=1 Tax=unclassified Streptomyces TaxID=2593676 RepID=UPI0037010727
MSFGRGTGLSDVESMTPNVRVVTGRVTRAAVPGLCAELESLLYDAEGAVRVPDDRVDCDVSGVARVDLVLVEAVARLDSSPCGRAASACACATHPPNCSPCSTCWGCPVCWT